jgi:hypothetical protein
MANIFPDIRPGALTQGWTVDFLRQTLTSLKGICAKLDDDSAVTDTDHEELCFTDLISIIVEDSTATRAGLTGTFIISPGGMDAQAVGELLYQIFNCIETLTEQLDAGGGVSDTNYEALCYTAILAGVVEDSKGNTLGNGTNFYFKSGATLEEKQLVDLFYSLLNCIETLTEKLDADGTVNNTNYEALWYTAVMLTKVRNSQGNLLGN